MALYDRLNQIGTALTATERANCGRLSKMLRLVHARLDSEDSFVRDVANAENDLLELADQLDTLARPIVAVPAEQKS